MIFKWKRWIVCERYWRRCSPLWIVQFAVKLSMTTAIKMNSFYSVIPIRIENRMTAICMESFNFRDLIAHHMQLNKVQHRFDPMNVQTMTILWYIHSVCCAHFNFSSQVNWHTNTCRCDINNCQCMSCLLRQWITEFHIIPHCLCQICKQL